MQEQRSFTISHLVDVHEGQNILDNVTQKNAENLKGQIAQKTRILPIRNRPQTNPKRGQSTDMVHDSGGKNFICQILETRQKPKTIEWLNKLIFFAEMDKITRKLRGQLDIEFKQNWIKLKKR